MPQLELFVNPVRITGVTEDGDLPLSAPRPEFTRVPLRRLSCYLRVPPIPGAWSAVIDTGAPLSMFPHDVWAGHFNWRAGRDFDELPLASPSTLRGQTLGYSYAVRLVRLRVPVVLAGRDLTAPRLRIDSLVTQLAEPGGPPFILLGLWGGVFDNRRLQTSLRPDGTLTATLEF